MHWDCIVLHNFVVELHLVAVFILGVAASTPGIDMVFDAVADCATDDLLDMNLIGGVVEILVDMPLLAFASRPAAQVEVRNPPGSPRQTIDCK